MKEIYIDDIQRQDNNRYRAKIIAAGIFVLLIAAVVGFL
jgi:hypothetical protein